MRTPETDRAGNDLWKTLRTRALLLILLVIAVCGIGYLMHLYAFRH